MHPLTSAAFPPMRLARMLVASAFVVLGGWRFRGAFDDQLPHFMKHLALAGGLLLLSATAPGK